MKGTLEERFWPKVVARPDGCWQWTAGLNASGYGMIGRGRRAEGTARAHVLSYELLIGPVPVGLELDHLCRQRWCVNPTHTEAVTHAENMRRSPFLEQLVRDNHAAKKARTHCPHGHSFADAYVSRGARLCRTCTLESNRRSRRRHAA